MTDFRMQPEWDAHDATWLSWPHNSETWPGTLHIAEQAMVELVRALVPAEQVRINVLDATHEAHVRRLLRAAAPPDALVYHRIATDDAWIRDHGAIIVQMASAPCGRAALDFVYNAWGGKYPDYELDQKVAAQMADILGITCFAPDFVLEGGSIDVNGAGALLTTRQCLLNPNRNPGLEQSDIESVLCRYFGVDQIIWLGRGIEGDDTDGHVDDITRFVSTDTVVTAVETNGSDPNSKPLAENRDVLGEVELRGHGALEIVELPMPEPVFFGSTRLPASYANFYVANAAVVVPVFACPEDDRAIGVLQDLFPSRRIAPIDCRGLIQGLGALHCLTQQVPAAAGR